MTSHCLNQSWLIVNWTPRKKLQRNLHIYTTIFIKTHLIDKQQFRYRTIFIKTHQVSSTTVPASFCWWLITKWTHQLYRKADVWKGMWPWSWLSIVCIARTNESYHQLSGDTFNAEGLNTITLNGMKYAISSLSVFQLFICENRKLTHWGWDKMAAILQTALSNALFQWNNLNCYSNFTEICSKASNW